MLSMGGGQRPTLYCRLITSLSVLARGGCFRCAFSPWTPGYPYPIIGQPRGHSRPATTMPQSMLTFMIEDVDLTKTGLRRLLALGLPSQSELDSAPDKLLLEMCSRFQALWHDLLSAESSLSLDSFEISDEHSGLRELVEGSDLWDRAVMICALYYSFSFCTYMGRHKSGGCELPAGVSRKEFQALGEMRPVDEIRLQVLELSNNYFATLIAFTFFRAIRILPHPTESHGIIEDGAHGLLRDLCHPRAFSDRFCLRAMLGWLQHNAAAYASIVYEVNPFTSPDHPRGVFSAIQLNELSSLANRTDRVIKQYGARNVARAFEMQLSLVIQSFGPHVALTRSGSSTVDLVCIASHSDGGMTFLLEAKTTKAKYALPKKDSRALRDYVAEVRAKLTTLPTVGFVLLVGPGPASTIDRKLASLEVQIGVPVRYLEAKSLAMLRERLPGPMDMQVFRDTLADFPRVLTEGFVDALVAHTRSTEVAHREFVKSLLSKKDMGQFTEETRTE